MIKIKAYAKLNLIISINPLRNENGRFPVHFIDSQLALHDTLALTPLTGAFELVCDSNELGCASDNFAYKAACLFKAQLANEQLGAKIVLKKQIPVKAGFGGGSSDAAAVIIGLSRLWNVKPTFAQINFLAAHLGKDFFYSLKGGLCEIVSLGTTYIARALDNVLKNTWVLILVPFESKPSTEWVYQNLGSCKF